LIRVWIFGKLRFRSHVYFLLVVNLDVG
jgi:hypothetical protein